MGSKKPSERIGAGTLKAMGRLGIAELRAAVYSGSNIAQPTEYGIWGKQTPQEIVEQMKSKDNDRQEQGHSILDERLEEANNRAGREPEGKEAPEPELD